ncbi:TPA: hypothetical protein DEP21_04635 [Patescibacteria group bacterium]|nr:hypothetical protein [Candidatus Gracilibacteria bacterium]
MWKEIIIVGLFGFLTYWTIKTKIWKTLLDKLGIKRFGLLTIGLIVFVCLIGLFYTGTSL